MTTQKCPMLGIACCMLFARLSIATRTEDPCLLAWRSLPKSSKSGFFNPTFFGIFGPFCPVFSGTSTSTSTFVRKSAETVENSGEIVGKMEYLPLDGALSSLSLPHLSDILQRAAGDQHILSGPCRELHTPNLDLSGVFRDLFRSEAQFCPASDINLHANKQGS